MMVKLLKIRLDPKSRFQSRKLCSDTNSTKERFKCLDYDNIKEQPVVEDERPDDASDPIKPTAITLVRPPR